MNRLRHVGIAAILTLAVAIPVVAHHEWPVDRTKQITIRGTVTAYRWAGPHVMITLDVAANGTIERWSVGASDRKYSAAGGWDKDTFKPGDVVTATGYRFRDGSNALEMRTIVTPSGKEMNYGSRPPRLTPPPGSPVAN